MGRSQRANRSPNRSSVRGDPTVGVDSRGEMSYPSTGSGYSYDWSNTWPSGTDTPVAATTDTPDE